MRHAKAPLLSFLTVLPLVGCDPMVATDEHVELRGGACETTVPLVIEGAQVGEVRAWFAGDQVCVELRARPQWQITATDLEIGPTHHASTFHREGLWSATDLQCVALDEVGGAGGEDLTITAHAELAQGSPGAATHTATAWSAGPDPEHGPEFGLSPGPCVPAEPSACGHVTHTQSQWGAVCSADNAGCYREKHFMTAFPEGLIVGCGVLTANLITPGAIESALPSAGTPRALLKSEAVAYDGVGDPKVATIFFGQVVSLGLNIGFDAMSSDPAVYPPLEDLVVTDATSPCLGMTVGQVHEQANLALGGCPASHSPATLNGCAQLINKAFAGGESCSPTLGVPQPPPQ